MKNKTHRIDITDISLPELTMYHDRSETRIRHLFEPEPGLFIAESARVALRALKAGYRAYSLLLAREELDKEDVRQLLSLAGEVPCYVAKEAVLKEITGYHLTRGVLAACYRKELPAPTDVIRNAKRVAVLEAVQNPANVGAIFRNAAALKWDAVLLAGGCTDPLYRRALRVSMGTVLSVPYAFVSSSVCEELKEAGFLTIAAALSEEAVSLPELSFPQEARLAVFFGTEDRGLSEEILSACDRTVRIPMREGVDSLNVAAASAVFFYALGDA